MAITRGQLHTGNVRISFIFCNETAYLFRDLCWKQDKRILNKLSSDPKLSVACCPPHNVFLVLWISFKHHRYHLGKMGSGDVLELRHYNDVITKAAASQITNLTIVYSSFYSGADQRKHQSSTSLAFVRGIHRLPVNSPHKEPVTRKMFIFDDVIMVKIWMEFWDIVFVHTLALFLTLINCSPNMG